MIISSSNRLIKTSNSDKALFISSQFSLRILGGGSPVVFASGGVACYTYFTEDYAFLILQYIPQAVYYKKRI